MQCRVRFRCIQHAVLICYLKLRESFGLTGLISSSQRCINLWLQSMGLHGGFGSCKGGMGYSCLRPCMRILDMHEGLADMNRHLRKTQKVYLGGRDGWMGSVWRLHNILKRVVKGNLNLTTLVSTQEGDQG